MEGMDGIKIKYGHSDFIFEKPGAEAEHEINMDGVLKLSIKNNSGISAYVSKGKGDFDTTYEIPNGETAVFATSTGRIIKNQSWHLHYDNGSPSANGCQIVKEIARD